MHVTTNGFEGLAVLVALAGVATTIFWMYVGWRAMEVHERLAQAARLLPGSRVTAKLNQSRVSEMILPPHQPASGHAALAPWWTSGRPE